MNLVNETFLSFIHPATSAMAWAKCLTARYESEQDLSQIMNNKTIGYWVEPFDYTGSEM